MTRSVLTVGEALAVLRSEPGEPVWNSSSLRLGTGGAEVNVAKILAHQSIDVTWAGRVGSDGLGRRVVRELRAEGVTTHVVHDPERPTGMILKDLRPDGRTEISNYRTDSAASRMTPADLDGVPVDDTMLVHVTGITLALSATARATVQHLVETAVRKGAEVSFDVNHRPRMWAATDPRDISRTYRAIARQAGTLFVSVDEVPYLLPGWTSDDPAAAAVALSNEGMPHAVVTAGAAGAVAHHDGILTHQPAIATIVVDTVGAGDAFAAGYLAAYLRGLDVGQRLLLGARLGAAACQHAGDSEGALSMTGDPDDSGDPVLR